jgi:hypothetical protein
MDKQEDNKTIRSDIKDKEIDIKKEKLNIRTKIEELEMLAHECLMNGNIDKAIEHTDSIIRLAIIGNMPIYIEEQQKFLNDIAKKVQKDYIISEIEKSGKNIKKIYEILINSDNVEQAHNILNDFKNQYKDNAFFISLPIIQELTSIDNKIWIEYNISKRDQLNRFNNKVSGEKDIKSELTKIKKFLKKI